MKRLLLGEQGIAGIIVVLIVLGVVVVGVVGIGAVVLSNDMKITVTNQSCGTWDIAEGSAALGFNFLPGINLPSRINQGETAIVQVPKTFIDSVTIINNNIYIQAFGQSFSFGTSDIDMQLSTLDGTPLSVWIGRQIDTSQDHTLIINCR